MVEFCEDVMIAAPLPTVWVMLSALEQWPTWTPTMTRIECLDPGPPTVGSRVRITQPRLRAAVWEIDDWRTGQGFSWFTTSPGLRVAASHEVRACEGGCVLSLALRFEGLLATMVGWLAGRITRRYLAQEARGLKRQCEAQQHA